MVMQGAGRFPSASHAKVRQLRTTAFYRRPSAGATAAADTFINTIRINHPCSNLLSSTVSLELVPGCTGQGTPTRGCQCMAQPSHTPTHTMANAEMPVCLNAWLCTRAGNRSTQKTPTQHRMKLRSHRHSEPQSRACALTEPHASLCPYNVNHNNTKAQA